MLQLFPLSLKSVLQLFSSIFKVCAIVFHLFKLYAVVISSLFKVCAVVLFLLLKFALQVFPLRAVVISSPFNPQPEAKLYKDGQEFNKNCSETIYRHSFRASKNPKKDPYWLLMSGNGYWLTLPCSLSESVCFYVLQG